MFKKVLKSLLVLTVVLATAGLGTRAWFTSEVTAQDNQITTGTLLLAVDSTDATDSYTPPGTGYIVVEQNEDGSVSQHNTFPAWTVAAPGDTYSVYLAVRNKGSIPFNYRAAALGAWQDGAPRFGTGSCPVDGADADANLVSVVNVHRYVSGNCESEPGCQNVRGWLNTGPWTEKAGTSLYDSGPVTGYYEDGFASIWTLEPSEYVLYRVDLKLSNTTDDCYQGATYHYDLLGEAKQEGATW